MVNSRLKFRAWEKGLKEMIPVDSIDFEKGLLNMGFAWRFFDEVELMQFTGLYDKNGKEIYEGDIIDGKFTDIGVDTGLVVFKGYGFKLEIPSVGDDDLVDLERNCESIEVIGNIYENPELLEESK